MADSNRNVHFLCPTNSPARPTSVNFAQGQLDKGAGQIGDRRQFSFSTGSAGRPQAVSFSTARCSEKGCVFPATSPDSGKCVYHTRQEEEPVLFRSHQPTGMLLDPARVGPANQDYDGSRKRDRRRMAAIWEQFQSDGTS
ncbi:MAG: hypothetical protein P8Z30_09370 [Acidobacteriota bacterium]